MRIYTRNGDSGKTDLLYGDRVDKDSLLLEVCGTIDELNAAIGLARCEAPSNIDTVLEQIQRNLFRCGTDLMVLGSEGKASTPIAQEDIADLEKTIDEFQAKLIRQKSFILPSGCRAAAALHLARTICRRAERRLISFLKTQQGPLPQNLSAYINRLGDLLFVLARAADAEAGIADTPC